MNWAVDPEERARRDRVRMKLFTTMLVAYGYAILGASLWEPLTGGRPIEPIHALLAALGLAMHATALYLAPQGEAT